MLTPRTGRGLVAKLRAVWSSVPLALRLYVGLMALVVGIGTLWLAARIHRRESAIREIERVGGMVSRKGGTPDWLPAYDWIDKVFELAGWVRFEQAHFRGTKYGIELENFQPQHADARNGRTHLGTNG